LFYKLHLECVGISIERDSYVIKTWILSIFGGMHNPGLYPEDFALDRHLKDYDFPSLQAVPGEE